MFKKLMLLIFSFLMLAQAVIAKDVFKITSVNFDTSNFIMYLASPDNTSEPILKHIKLVKLANPARVYFDIDSALLSTDSQNWYFNTGDIKQIKINQYSKNPDKVRVVMFLKEGFDYRKITFLKVNNNLVIRLKNVPPKNDYFSEIYRDQGYLNGDYAENTLISSSEIKNVPLVNNTSQDDVLAQIQKAFSANTSVDKIEAVSVKKIDNAGKKELKLISKAYINDAEQNSGGFLIKAAGPLCVQKPVYQSNPTRVTFDLPNVTMDSSFENKTFNIGKNEVVSFQKYSVNKVRVTITSSNADKFVPIYSADAQSILFVNPEKVPPSSFFSRTTDTTGYYYKSIDKKTDEFIISFNSPVVHAVKRDNNSFELLLYNAQINNRNEFKNAIRGTSLKDITLEELSKGGLVLNIPLGKDATAESFMGTDGKSIKILVTGPKETVVKVARKQETPVIKRVYFHSNYVTKPAALPAVPSLKNGKKSVVLDAGHGGSDYGAVRAGINEKDINLDVVKRIESILRSKGVAVYLTRDSDVFVSLQDRTVITANKKPDIFVSIHVNSCAGTTATGLETHYYHDDSIPLAKTVHASLCSYVKSPDRGLLKNRFYVINHTTVPAILVEIGFISNDKERAELVSEQRKQATARAVAEGIIKYLNSSGK